MTTYLARRFVISIITALGVAFLVVLVMRQIPGSAVDVILSTGVISADDRAALEAELGLDRSVFVQYGDWLWELLQGKLGDSIINGISIGDQLKEALPVSIQLGIMSLIFGIVFGIPIGVISAVRQDTWIDYFLRSFAVLLLSIPGFLIGTLVIVFGSRWFNWTPPIIYHEFVNEPLKNLEQFAIPAAILGFSSGAALMRFTRTAVLDTIRMDYVRTAQAKGLRERVVIWRHVLRNALIPVISVVGFFLAFVIGGTVIFEQLFQLPGMGRMLFTSINRRDYPAVQDIVLLFALVVVLVNLLTDVAYTFIDPRIRLS